MSRLLPLFSLLFSFPLLAGCLDSPTQQSCSPECSRGRVCNQATLSCVRVNQKKFDGNISGRAFDVVPVDDRVFVSAQNDVGDIIVSEFTGTSLKNAIILAEFEVEAIRKSVIDANNRTLVIAWREGDKYVVAYREIQRSRTRWNFQVVQGSYRATDDFDLLHVGDSFSLIFRDFSGGIFILDAAPSLEKKWSLSPIVEDVPSAPPCESSDPGFDIHVSARSTTLFAAYQDRGCGALMLLRREKDKWTSSVVDDGKELRSRKTRVGKQPAISMSEEGGIKISYTNSRNQLRIATEKEGAFELLIVDEGTNTDTLSREVQHHVGAFSSIISSAQSTKIAYYDGTEQRLLLATLEGDVWNINVVEEGDFIVGMNSKILSFSNRDWVFSEKLESHLELDTSGQERKATLSSSLIVIELRL